MPVDTPMFPTPRTIDELAAALADFADRRGWRPEHAPKNLAMALVAEAGELAAEFQWLTLEQSEAVADPVHSSRAAVEDELADVMLYLTRLADILGVDLLAVSAAKMARNERRFPVA
jgi:NTP pyrophosphatase (non-canonical NTP hydrolase)